MGYTTDEKLLLAQGGALLSYGAAFGLMPKETSTLLFKNPVDNLAPHRYTGLVSAGIGAASIATVRTEDNDKEKLYKNLMRCSGVCWGAGTAYNIAHMATGQMKLETGIPNAVVTASFSGVMLWRGFRKEKKKASIAAKDTKAKK